MDPQWNPLHPLYSWSGNLPHFPTCIFPSGAILSTKLVTNKSLVRQSQEQQDGLNYANNITTTTARKS
jgi:hypothetical protein